jgi:glycerol kinase
LCALPAVQESQSNFGETTLDGLLDRPIPIAGVMGDSQAALFAERCVQPGSAKVTLGTGSSVLLNIGDTLRLSTSGIVTTIAWVLDGRSTFAFEGIINSTGAAIAWLRDQLGLIADPGESEALARSVVNNGGVYLVPAFVGLGAPYWQADARGAIVGLTPSSSKAHVVRAALEAIAYQVKDVLDLMIGEASTLAHLQRLHADGGMVRNAFLMQFMAGMLGIDVRVSRVAELSAFGAVLMGLRPSLAALDQLPHETVDYVPAMDAATAAALYAGWQAAVRQVIGDNWRNT